MPEDTSPNTRKILALDLGTKTGYAMTQGNQVIAGTWVLGKKSEIAEWGKNRITRRCDPRVTGLFNALRNLRRTENIEQVVFEDVQFSSSTYQTQLWSSYRAAVWCAFYPETAMIPGTLIECVPTGTLKKFATQHGGATKEMMQSALFKFHPGWRSANLDDNAIDALWLWYWADKHLKLA